MHNLIDCSTYILPQSQFLLLSELFDYRLPFYQRCGLNKPSLAASTAASSGNSANVSPDHMKFVNELDEGSCFDYYCEGIWELAIVEKLSELRSEFEINLPERK